MLFRSSDAACRPITVIGVGIIHHVIHDSRNVHAGPEQCRLVGHGDKREKSAVAQAPHANAVRVHVRQALQIIPTHPGVFRVFPAHVHVHAGAPIPAVTDAPAIIRCQDHVPFLEKGYVVLAPDYRGSIGYGRDWRTGVYMDVGGKDAKDAWMGGNYLKSLPYVDANRIGVWGLSYGGFFTLIAMTDQPTLFRAGVDVAG